MLNSLIPVYLYPDHSEINPDSDSQIMYILKFLSQKISK